jgi:hypothetical protein
MASGGSPGQGGVSDVQRIHHKPQDADPGRGALARSRYAPFSDRELVFAVTDKKERLVPRSYATGAEPHISSLALTSVHTHCTGSRGGVRPVCPLEVQKVQSLGRLDLLDYSLQRGPSGVHWTCLDLDFAGLLQSTSP